jgi:cupin 2 domain-containing protein
MPSEPSDVRSLLAVPAQPTTNEVFEPLIAGRKFSLVRIVSTGQASPAGFWYDQADDEWVLVISGWAALRFEHESVARALLAGQYIHIPAHCRHRIEQTSPDEPTIWLALHFESDEAG